MSAKYNIIVSSRGEFPSTPPVSVFRLRKTPNLIVSILLSAAAFLASAHVADATIWIVGSSADSGAGSLRQAVASVSSGDTIEFDSSLNGSTITLTSGEIAINESLTITGPGASQLTISGNGANRVFHFKSGTSTISGLTISDGKAAGGNGSPGDGGGGGGGGMGGGVLADSSSTVTILNVTFSSNTAIGGTGGHNGGAGGAAATGAGGGAGNGGTTGALAGVGSAGDNSFGNPISGGAAGSNPGGGGGGAASGIGAAGPGGDGSFGGGGGGGGGNGGYGAAGGDGGASAGFGGTGGAGGFATAGGGGGGGAGLGGALCVWQNAQVVVSNVTFQNNTATGGGGGSGANGGGSGNDAGQSGSAGQGKGAAIFVYPGGVALATNLTFSGDSSANGGSSTFATDGLVKDNADVYGSFLNLDPVTNTVVYPTAEIWTDGNADFYTDDTATVVGEVVDWVADTDQNGYDDATALKFDVSSFSSPVSKAYLRIHVTQTFGTPYLSVYGSTDNSWTTSSMTFPVLPGSAIDSDDTTDMAAGDWKLVDVTSFVNSTISGSGIASFALTNEIYGSDYNGDGIVIDAPESSLNLLRPALLITPAATAINTTVGLNSSASPSTWGESVTFTATVTPANGSMAPTGTVNFYDGATLINSGTLTGSGSTATASISTSALSVASHTISAGYTGDSNFNGSTNQVTQVVNLATQAALGFSPASPQTYGSTVSLSTTGGSGSGAVSYSVVSGPGQIVSGTSLLVTAGSGTVTVQATKASDGHYASTNAQAMVSAQQAPLTITATNQTKVYGAALPTLGASYSGLVSGDTTASLTTLPTITTTATAASHVSGSPYSISISGAVDANYSISYVDGTLTVTTAPLTITANNKTKSYGAAMPTLTASYSGFVNGDTPASLSTLPTITTTATAASHVSGNPYAITASDAADSDYAISYVSGSLNVQTVPLTITATSTNKAYGAALPGLTASYSGFVNGDTTASLTTLATITTTATSASHVSGSPYTITASGAVDTDYSFTYIPASLTVTNVPLTITANSTTKLYGAALPILTASYSGLVNGDTSASLATLPTITTTATSASHVSGSPYTITASGAVDTDYTISYAAGTLTVTTAPLTITANNLNKIYGAALPTLTASYTGLVNGDTSASLTTGPTLTTTATASSHVSGNPYSITASGAVDSDYSISYVSGSLTVTTAPLTITVGNQTKPYGAALPTLTASFTGLVNGDTATSLATLPTISTTATASSHLSGNPYPITASGAVDSDYSFTYVQGSLTVTTVPLTITANNLNKIYGAALPTLTVSYTGLVNGDTSASLMTGPTLSTTATSSSHVSGNPYTITPSGAVDSDYSISYVSGSLTVTTAPLTITANNQTKSYTAGLPQLTVSYSGFVNGDTSASLTVLPTVTTTATSASHASGNPYPITASGAVDTDYSISYVPGTLTVTGGFPLTITVNSATKVYGAPVPILTASYSGFVNGDTPVNLSTLPTFTTPATAGSHVNGGPYPITASAAVDPDYVITYIPGTLTVTPAPLTITANNQTKTYGAALSQLTANYSGFATGDTAASLTSQPSLTTTATAASHVGASPFPITISGASDPDYQISYVPGTLTVTPAPLTITASNQTKAYNAPLPTLTLGYSGFVNGDSIAKLSAQPTLNTTATAGSHASGNPYPITATGAVDADYSFIYVPGALTVTPIPLTITANNATKPYGAPLPTFTASYSGFENGDTSASLAPQPTFSTTATASSGVGAYPITISGEADPDYQIIALNGSLTINGTTLTVTASNATRPFGTANPTFTGTVVGLTNGDVISASYTTDAQTNSPFGNYTITPALVDPMNLASNYNVILVDGVLSVSMAITLNPNPANFVVGNGPIFLDTNGMVNDGGTFNYVGAILTVTVATNAGPDDTLELSSQGPGSDQLGGPGEIVTLDGDSVATLWEAPGYLVLQFGSGVVTSAMVTALLDQVTFSADPSVTNERVIQVTLDYSGTNSVSASRSVILDHRPAFENLEVVATRGVTLNLLVNDLLTNVTDLDGNTVTLQSADSVSEEGGTITDNGTTVTYVPPTHLTGNNDMFGLLFSDGHGGLANGFVSIHFVAPNQLNINGANIAASGVQLTLGVTPGEVYDVEVSTDLVNWDLLETVTASPAGIIDVVDNEAKNFPLRFYRAVSQ